MLFKTFNQRAFLEIQPDEEYPLDFQMIKNYNSDKQQHEQRDKRNKDEDLENWGNPLKSNLDDSSVIKGLRIKKQKRKKMRTTIEEFYQM